MAEAQLPHPNRRGAIAIGAGALVAACARPLFSGAPPHAIDAQRLGSGFAALAQRALPGRFALGVMDLQASKSWYSDPDHSFPLAGAFAAPLAVAAMSEVDGGRLALTEQVSFDAMELSPPPGPIDTGWPTPPEGHTGSLSAGLLLNLALRGADATAADVLMKRIGGPGAVSAFLEQKGIEGLRVDRYRRELLVEAYGMPTFRPAWKDLAAFAEARGDVPAEERREAMKAAGADQRDTATVPAALGFLAMLSAGDLIQPASAVLLIGWMEGAHSAPAGFAAGLPAGVRLASAGGALPSDLGVTPGVAEIGLATWPDGRRFALAAFLAGSTAPAGDQDRLFADAARLAAQAVG